MSAANRPRRGSFHELGPLQPPGFSPRRIRIYLPDDGAAEHPALVLFDGQNVFADPNAPRGGWGVDTAVDGLDLRRSIAPMIVAVPHDPNARQDELTPWPIDGHGGGAWRMIDWVADAVLPAVRARFAMPSGALGAVLGGASWGGLCALVGHHARPDAFGGALCLSPAAWVGEFAVFDWLARHHKPTFSRIYLDCGAHEAEGRMLPPAAELAKRLAARGYERKQLRWVADPHGEHTEADWRRRLPRALRFMFRR
ncbi:MAG: alpha/beta hydrolase [Deltaproteobacteria bacterium]|nr:alpha/beta hydrolase [Deltaproteobacteria bacterium]